MVNKYMIVIKSEFRRRKQALVIGGLVGLALAWYTINQGVDLQAIANAGEGLVDDLLGRSSNPLDMAKTKIYIVFGVVGSALGYFLDKLLEELGLVKKRR